MFVSSVLMCTVILWAFEHGYKYIRFVLASNVHCAYAFYIWHWCSSEQLSMSDTESAIENNSSNNNNNSSNNNNNNKKQQKTPTTTTTITTTTTTATTIAFKGAIPQLYSLLTAPRTVSNTHAQVAPGRNCLQITCNMSCATQCQGT